MEKHKPKLLIRGVNWLGDAIMSLPAIYEIKRLFPEYEISVYTPIHLKELYELLPFKINIISFEKPHSSLSYIKELKKIKEIKQKKFELCFIFPLSIHSTIIPFLSDIPVRVGYKRNFRQIFLTHPYEMKHNFKMEKHQSYYYLELIQQFTKKETKMATPQLKITDKQKTEILKKLEENGFKGGEIIGISPGAEYGPAKRWPLQNWHLLISYILQNTDYTIVITGTMKDKKSATFLKDKTKKRVIDFTGELSLKEFFALLSICSAFISNDSGAMHSASIAGTKAIGLFGSTSPIATAPIGKKKYIIYKNLECSPCFERKCKFGHYNCLKNITPKEVFETLSQII